MDEWPLYASCYKDLYRYLEQQWHNDASNADGGLVEWCLCLIWPNTTPLWSCPARIWKTLWDDWATTNVLSPFENVNEALFALQTIPILFAPVRDVLSSWRERKRNRTRSKHGTVTKECQHLIILWILRWQHVYDLKSRETSSGMVAINNYYRETQKGVRALPPLIAGGAGSQTTKPIMMIRW